VILELCYVSEEDRVFGRNPNQVQLSIRLYANTTLLAIKHAEGLIEYLRHGAPSSFSNMSGKGVALIVGTLVVMIFGFAYVKYWAPQKDAGCCAKLDDLHLYRSVDQPTIFRLPNDGDSRLLVT